MQKQGLGTRGWVLGIGLGLGLLGVFSQAGFADLLPATGTYPSLGITVRVYDYARVSPGEMRRAEAEASGIFREAGVEMDWVDCPTSVAEAADYPACEPPAGARGVDLRILPKSMALRVKSGREQLGFALPSARAGFASSAWVFYHRVEELAASKDADGAQILGHAIAHEIGHLLLGPDRHSGRGIMRAAWGRADLQLAAQGQLLFTTQEIKNIHTEVQARGRNGQESHASRLPPRE